MNTFYNASILLYTFWKNFDRLAKYKGEAKPECYIIANQINCFYLSVTEFVICFNTPLFTYLFSFLIMNIG